MSDPELVSAGLTGPHEAYTRAGISAGKGFLTFNIVLLLRPLSWRLQGFTWPFSWLGSAEEFEPQISKVSVFTRFRLD